MSDTYDEHNYLVVDTETTGLLNTDLPLLVAAVVMDSLGKAVASIDFLIQPPRDKNSCFCYGWPESSPYHDVTADAAARHGVPFAIALGEIRRMAEEYRVDKIVAYNASFDKRMFRQAQAVSHGRPDLSAHPSDPNAGFWELPWVCALALARTKRAKGTSYKLQDVYSHLFGEEDRDQVCWHDALEDALAAGRVYAHLVRNVGGPGGDMSDDALLGRDQANALVARGANRGPTVRPVRISWASVGGIILLDKTWFWYNGSSTEPDKAPSNIRDLRMYVSTGCA